MELLLFLSALLTGLTGVISGERKAEPAQVQRSAAEVAVNIVAVSAETAVPAIRASIAMPALPELAQVAQPFGPRPAATPLQDPHRVDERRLE